MSYWLFKSEPSAFSIDDLAKAPKKRTSWDGVRNFQARNFMRDGMKKGDRGFFYHSSADPAAIVGTVTIVREAYPDPTQFDAQHDHFDPKSKLEAPQWVMVDLELDRRFDRLLGLEALRGVKGLEAMELLRKGSRLSVQPVTEKEWAIVCKLAGVPA
jgi:predicted RNA-binding protein with PUA-like domain